MDTFYKTYNDMKKTLTDEQRSILETQEHRFWASLKQKWFMLENLYKADMKKVGEADIALWESITPELKGQKPPKICFMGECPGCAGIQIWGTKGANCIKYDYRPPRICYDKMTEKQKDILGFNVLFPEKYVKTFCPDKREWLYQDVDGQWKSIVNEA